MLCNRFLILFFFIASFQIAKSQIKRDYLVFEGTITIVGKKSDNKVEANLTSNGRKQYFRFDALTGDYQIRLAFNREYELVFSANGYVSQRVLFKTYATKQRIREGFPEYELNMDLKHQIDKRPFTIQHNVFFRSEVNNFDLEESYVLATNRQMKEYRDNISEQKRDDRQMKDIEEEIRKEDLELARKDSLSKLNIQKKTETVDKKKQDTTQSNKFLQSESGRINTLHDGKKLNIRQDSLPREEIKKYETPKKNATPKAKQNETGKDIDKPKQTEEKKVPEKKAEVIKKTIETDKNLPPPANAPSGKGKISEQEKIRLEAEKKALLEKEKKIKQDQKLISEAEKIRSEAEKKAREAAQEKERQKAIEEEKRLKNAEFRQEHLEQSIPLERRVKEKIENVKKAYPIKEKDVVLKVYDAVKNGFKMKYHGFIDFGDGKGRIEITEEEFREFSKYFPVKTN